MAGYLSIDYASLTDVGVRSLISQPPTLEELFLRHYQQTPAAEERPSELSR